MSAAVGRAPVRIVHLGLGAFHRAHQAWYTQAADPAWGIAAFSGRSAALAETLTAQDCVYTLVERGPEADLYHRMTALVRAHGGQQRDKFVQLVADADVAVVTLTVTERGYRDGPDSTAPRLLLDALDARRKAGVGGLALVPCDNLRSNGARLRTLLLGMAAERDRALEQWIREYVSFVDTVADRITPAATAQDAALAAEATGFDDRAPVTTEPFAEWVLAGAFPAGRPAWERAGARFVDDIEPYELRKLRLLNGGHTLLALTGLPRGHETVADAMADERIRALLDEYWAAASTGIPDAEAYVDSVRARFGNPRIRYRLEQIAQNAEEKLRERILPVVAELADRGADPAPALRVVAAWLQYTGAAESRSARTAALARLVPTPSPGLPLLSSLEAALTTLKD